jgi:hypothetical protein
MAQEKLYSINIEGLEEFYISKSGNVYRPDRTYIKPRNNKGYLQVSLNYKVYYIHRLMAFTFIPIIDTSKNVVNHINSIKTDNTLENLEWVTQKENVNKSKKPTGHPRRVLQIDKETNQLVRAFDSILQATQITKYNQTTITNGCLGVGNKIGKYQWKYEDETFKHNHIQHANIEDAIKIYDYDNYFLFSDGRVYNSKRKAFLKPTGNIELPYVTLCKNKQKRNCYISRLLKDHYPEKYLHTSESSDTKSVEKSSDGSR